MNDQLPAQKLEEKHEKKLHRLVQQQQHSQHRNSTHIRQQQYDTANVINNSNVNLSKDHLKVLAKGLKFVTTPTSLNIVEIIANTEKSLSSMPTLFKQSAISEISTFVTKWRKPTLSNISKDEQKLLKEIKMNESIIVVQADKGGKVVVMGRHDYISKVEEKLNDTNLYELVKDPTTTLKKKINQLATRLFKKNRITEFQKYDFSSIDNLATVRGQPKIHKNGNPMRIITCTRSTITSSISKFTFQLIKQLRETIDKSVTNTNGFISQISRVTLDDDERLVSLDVQDLFTNVDVNKAITIVMNRIGQSETFCNSTLTKTDLKELLLLCLQNSYFTFNGKYYRQKRGLPMGNLLSPLLSDLFMHDYISENLSEQKEKLWRYVDDLFLITKVTETEPDSFVEKLNLMKGTIKFTHEYEKNQQLNYLDTTLTRNTLDKNIKIRWFRKETASDRLLNYQSCHQPSIKRNIVKNMTERIISTTKDAQEQQEDLNILKDMLSKSNYPKHEVNKLIQETLRQHNSNTTQSTTTKDNEMEFSMSLPYVPGIEVLKRKLEKLKIKLYFSYPKKLTSSLPSNIKPQSKSIIYKIPCDCGASYVGETKVGLEKRMNQHRQLIEKDEKETHSEIVQHHHSKRWQCMFDPSKAVIIDNEIEYRKRKIKETVYSNINQSINKHDTLNAAWSNIISKHAESIKKRIRIKEQFTNATINNHLLN